MATRIGTSSGLVVLCAGRQTRFDGEGRKVLADLGGEPLAVRLARQLDVANDYTTVPVSGGNVVFVVAPDWTDDERAVLEPHGKVAVTERDSVCGSMADGLSALTGLDAVLVMSGDTAFVGDVPPIPGARGWALYDPWANVSSVILVPNADTVARLLEVDGGKLDYIARFAVPCTMVKASWVNCNTSEALEEARRMLEGMRVDGEDARQCQ
jgi:hypothetical protein